MGPKSKRALKPINAQEIRRISPEAKLKMLSPVFAEGYFLAEAGLAAAPGMARRRASG